MSSLPPSTSELNSMTAKKIVEIIQAAHAVSINTNLRKTLYDVASGVQGSCNIQHETPLAFLERIVSSLVNVAATGASRRASQPTRPDPKKINRNPCLRYSEKRQGCVVVSGENEPLLCGRCRKRDLLECIMKPIAAHPLGPDVHHHVLQTAVDVNQHNQQSHGQPAAPAYPYQMQDQYQMHGNFSQHQGHDAHGYYANRAGPSFTLEHVPAENHANNFSAGGFYPGDDAQF